MMESLGCKILESPVHALEPTIGPRMLQFSQTMVDIVLSAGVLEGVCPEEFSHIHGGPEVGYSPDHVSRRYEVGAVVDQHRMNLVQDSGDEAPEEVGDRPTNHLLVHLGEGELGCAIDRDQQVEVALFGPDSVSSGNQGETSRQSG